MGKSSAPLVLGIESSCDETGIGIVLGRKLLANEIASSVTEHARFGGVVPEVAARAHVDAILPAIERNAPAVFLEVRAENEQARALYAKNGFTQISVRKNYYQNAQPRSKKSDAIIMQKTLGATHE